MERIEITGGRTLAGRVRPACAKNSVLPLLAATLLCREPCTLCGVPDLADVQTSLQLLAAVGGGEGRRWVGRSKWRRRLRRTPAGRLGNV